MSTITVDVDLDYYIDEFLEGTSDKELKKELEKRGYEVFKKGKPKSMGVGMNRYPLKTQRA